MKTTTTKNISDADHIVAVEMSALQYADAIRTHSLCALFILLCHYGLSRSTLLFSHLFFMVPTTYYKVQLFPEIGMECTKSLIKIKIELSREMKSTKFRLKVPLSTKYCGIPKGSQMYNVLTRNRMAVASNYWFRHISFFLFSTVTNPLNSMRTYTIEQSTFNEVRHISLFKFNWTREKKQDKKK